MGHYCELRKILCTVSAVCPNLPGGGAGGGDRVIQALDTEMRGQAGRHGAAHGARHQVRAHAAHTPLAQGIGAPDDILAGSPAGTGDQAGARIRDAGGVAAADAHCEGRPGP